MLHASCCFLDSAWLSLLPLPSEANMFSFLSRCLWPLSSSTNSGSSPPSPSRKTRPSHTASSVLPNSPLVTRSLKVTMGRCTAVHPVHGRVIVLKGFMLGIAMQFVTDAFTQWVCRTTMVSVSLLAINRFQSHHWLFWQSLSFWYFSHWDPPSTSEYRA